MCQTHFLLLHLPKHSVPAMPSPLPGAPAADGSFAVFQGPYDALGVSIAGGKGSPLGDIPIFIAMIQASGVAARTQRLRVSTGALLAPNIRKF